MSNKVPYFYELQEHKARFGGLDLLEIFYMMYLYQCHVTIKKYFKRLRFQLFDPCTARKCFLRESLDLQT